MAPPAPPVLTALSEMGYSCRILSICHIWMFAKYQHHGQMDLNKKSGTMHQTLIFFNIDAFRKTKIENPPTWEIGVIS